MSTDKRNILPDRVFRNFIEHALLLELLASRARALSVAFDLVDESIFRLNEGISILPWTVDMRCMLSALISSSTSDREEGIPECASYQAAQLFDTSLLPS